MKKNIVIALFSLIAMLSMSSCASMGNALGSGTIGGIIADVVVGTTVGHNTPAGRVAAHVAGRWNDGSVVITATKAANIYNVLDKKDGSIESYYLMPITKAMQTKPNCGPVISYEPIYRAKELRWKVKTAGGTYHVFPGGTWISC